MFSDGPVPELMSSIRPVPNRDIQVNLNLNEATELLDHLVANVPEGDKRLERVMLKLVDSIRATTRCESVEAQK